MEPIHDGTLWKIKAFMKETNDELPACFLHPSAIVADLRRDLASRGVSERLGGHSLAVEAGSRLTNRQLLDWETLQEAGLQHGACVRVWANPLRLATTASVDGTAKIWNTITGECLQTMVAGKMTIESAESQHSSARSRPASQMDEQSQVDSFRPGGEELSSRQSVGSSSQQAGEDSLISGSARGTDAGSNAELADADRVSVAILSSSGDRVLTASDSTVALIWNVADGACMFTLSGHEGLIRSAAFSPNEKTVVTASDDNTAIIWDVDVTGDQLHVLSTHGHFVRFVCFSPEGLEVLTAAWDTDAKIWDATSGECRLTLSAHGHFVRSACWSPCGHGVATASSDKSANIWNSKTGECIETCRGHKGTIYTVSFSPDSQLLLTASFDCTARLWSVENGNCLHALVGHGSIVRTAYFSPLGDTIVTSSYDFTAKVWSTSTGRCIQTLSGHSANVCFATFSADGDEVITTSFDRSAKLWKVNSGRCVLTFLGHTKTVLMASFTPW